MGVVTVGYKCRWSRHLASGGQWLGIGWAPWRGRGGGTPPPRLPMPPWGWKRLLLHPHHPQGGQHSVCAAEVWDRRVGTCPAHDHNIITGHRRWDRPRPRPMFMWRGGACPPPPPPPRVLLKRGGVGGGGEVGGPGTRKSKSLGTKNSPNQFFPFLKVDFLPLRNPRPKGGGCSECLFFPYLLRKAPEGRFQALDKLFSHSCELHVLPCCADSDNFLHRLRQR